jgi:hypothetical protein
MRKKSATDTNKEIDKSKNLVLLINLPQMDASIKSIGLNWRDNFLVIEGYCRRLKGRICLYEFRRGVNLPDLKDKLDLKNATWRHYPEAYAVDIIIPFLEQNNSQEKVNNE